MNWLGRNEEVSGIGRLRRGKGKREGSEMGSRRRSIGRALVLVLVCSGPAAHASAGSAAFTGERGAGGLGARGL